MLLLVVQQASMQLAKLVQHCAGAFHIRPPFLPSHTVDAVLLSPVTLTANNTWIVDIQPDKRRDSCLQLFTAKT